MTRKLLEDTLAKQGLKAFTARGLPFDPHVHEAMGHEERQDVAPNMVSTEVLRGFTLHDRLVRPALVMVARAPAPAPSSEPGAGPDVAEDEPTSPETEAPGGTT